MDLEAYRLTSQDIEERVVTKEKKMVRRFIKGPIPLNWLKPVYNMPDYTLKVALILWYVSGLAKRKKFTLSNKRVSEFKVNRWTKYRALKNLESAGLVRVDRANKKSPVVTILT